MTNENQELLRKQQRRTAVQDTLKQRDFRLIIFPDWSQPEDLLFQELASVISVMVTHPDKSRMILFVDTSNTAEEDAKQALSGVVSSVLPPEALDDPDGPVILPVGKLNEIQWQELLSRLYARIVLEHENKQAITAARADKMQSCELDSFINELVPPEKLINLFFDHGSSLFKQIGNAIVQLYLIELGELKPNEKVLEIGCGCGRVALPLTKYLEDGGSYEGLDIVVDSINWCKEKITPNHPNFRFKLADIYNKLYTPNGQLTASEYKFPYDNESFDFVFLTAVFLHMLPPDIENYFSEIVRVLKRGGKCLITFFLLNAESLKLIEEKLSFYDLKYKIGNYLTVDRDVPEITVAHDESFIRSLYEKHQLKIVEPIHYGCWCGRKPFLDYRDHDIIIAVK